MEQSASFLDLSYDKTGEDLLEESRLRSGKKFKKRPSAPPIEDEKNDTPPKRFRDEKVRESKQNYKDSGWRLDHM